MASTNRDPRYHTQNMQKRLGETRDHLRQDIDQVDEPQLKACSRPRPRFLAV
jgi:hypothetical protein